VLHSPAMIPALHGPWLVGTLAALALAGFLVGLLRRVARRRARRAYFARSANESHLLPLAEDPEPPSRSISPERAAAIRSHAEKSAQHDWAAGHGSELGPYERGTPEHVLWFATYHLHLGDLAEAAEAEAEADAVANPERREATTGGTSQ